jgi:hypothetical protein
MPLSRAAGRQCGLLSCTRPHRKHVTNLFHETTCQSGSFDRFLGDRRRRVALCAQSGDSKLPHQDVRIKVVGLGGGGGNAVNRMVAGGVQVGCTSNGLVSAFRSRVTGPASQLSAAQCSDMCCLGYVLGSWSNGVKLDTSRKYRCLLCKHLQ